MLFAVFTGLANHISNAQLVPFMSNMHTALWCLAGISLARGGDLGRAPEARERREELEATGVRESTAEQVAA